MATQRRYSQEYVIKDVRLKVHTMVLGLIKFCYKKIIFFGKESNIHGLHYVADRNRHWFARMFWFISLLLCSWGLWEILRGTLKAAHDEALSFNPDTNKLLWNTVFPSVTICEKYDYTDTLDTINELYPSFLSNFDFGHKKIIADLCFFESYTAISENECNPKKFNCSFNWRPLVEKVRKPCSDLIFNCYWKNDPLECCKYFLPIDSEYGTCYSFNTLQSRLTDTIPLFKSNRSTGPGVLSFSPNNDLDVFIHGNEDVPWIKSDLDMKLDITEFYTKFVFNIIEMSNEPLVKTVDLSIRKCRFKDETIPSEFDKSFRIYGYTTCMTICVTELMYQECNCVHHLRDVIYSDITCDYSGLLCIKKYAEAQKVLLQNDELCSHCLPACEEIELTKLLYKEYSYQSYCVDGNGMSSKQDDFEQNASNPCYNESQSIVSIHMNNLPNIKYRRNVVRTELDLVVSVGGLAGLFFGASLLSLVEALYYLFIRAPEEGDE